MNKKNNKRKGKTPNVGLSVNDCQNTISSVDSDSTESTVSRSRSPRTPLAQKFWWKPKTPTLTLSTASLSQVESLQTTGESDLPAAETSKSAPNMQREILAVLAKEAVAKVVVSKNTKDPAVIDPNRKQLQSPGTGRTITEDTQESVSSDRSASEEKDNDDGGEKEEVEDNFNTDECITARKYIAMKDGGDSGLSSDAPWSRSSSSQPCKSDDGYKLLMRAKRHRIMKRAQNQQQHYHHHFHHDHHHIRRYSTGGLPLSDHITSTQLTYNPTTHGPNEYNHHHHHHHYHHHYYHFRGRSVKSQSARPASYSPPSTQTGIEEVEEDVKRENDDSNTISFAFLDTPTVKTPSSINRKIKNIFKKFTSKNTPSKLSVNDGDSNTTASESKYDLSQSTLECVMDELLKTEKEYIADLSLVVDGYMAVMDDSEVVKCGAPIPEDLKINSMKYKLIFGIIKSIYEWHKDVSLPALERYINEPYEFDEVLKKVNDVLKMYSNYHQNIDNINYVVIEYESYFEKIRNILGHKLQISSIMIKPFQRIMKYNELLKKILECVEQWDLKIDVKLIQKTIDDLNEFILNFDGKKIADKTMYINSMPSTNILVPNACKNPLEEARQQLKHVMHELIDTEEIYVRDLGFVVNGYMTVIANPAAEGCDISTPLDFQSNSLEYNLVFGDIKQIYQWHKDKCLPVLKKCVNKPEKLQDLFIKFHSVMPLYETYCQKKSTSELLVAKHRDYLENIQQFLNYNMHISSIMIKPVQRITKYNQLLDQIIKYLERAGLSGQIQPVKNAIDTISKFVHQLNETTIVARLLNFDGQIKDQGELLMHGTLKCAEKYNGVEYVKLVYKDLYVFLFFKIMIFSVEVPDKYNPSEPLYYYKDHIYMNKMKLAQVCDSSTGSFIIESTDQSRPLRQYICRPLCCDSPSKWFQKLRELKKCENVFLEDLMNPLLNTK